MKHLILLSILIALLWAMPTYAQEHGQGEMSKAVAKLTLPQLNSGVRPTSNKSVQSSPLAAQTYNTVREYIPWRNTNEVRRFVNESEIWKRELTDNYTCVNFAMDFMEYALERGRIVHLYFYDAPGTKNDHMANAVIIKKKFYIVEPQWKWGGLKEIGGLR